ncbi:MAG: polyphosphate polymerase domain-containing protein [Oscillospiraceae bacterium]|jgi:hypothetical protein|nr:polyphosphate polymerase domain-containing protein [Oscillospiraceae bacterium]
MIQNIFERKESKYWVMREQADALIDISRSRLEPDAFGSYEIRSVYFDTDAYDLIRASIEKPPYKEKLRLRSYGTANDDSTVFLELKKKYKGVVFKRRADLTLSQAMILIREGIPPQSAQILREIEAFRARFPVSPKAFIAYDRTAFAGTIDAGLRVTFDDNIRFRTHTLRLDRDADGQPLGVGGCRLMEIKIPGAFPLWLSRTLSELEIFPTSFSKYAQGYLKYILPKLLSGISVLSSNYIERAATYIAS